MSITVRGTRVFLCSARLIPAATSARCMSGLWRGELSLMTDICGISYQVSSAQKGQIRLIYNSVQKKVRVSFIHVEHHIRRNQKSSMTSNLDSVSPRCSSLSSPPSSPATLYESSSDLPSHPVSFPAKTLPSDSQA